MTTRIRKLKITTRDGRVLLDDELRTTTIDSHELDSTIELFRIISSKTRYDVLTALRKNSCCFTELTLNLGYSQKTIAQCLDDLLKIKAIAREERGYSISPIGKIIFLQLRDLSAMLKKIEEVEDMDLDFEL